MLHVHVRRWFSRWISRESTGARAGRRPAVGVEQLEDRATPAALALTVPALPDEPAGQAYLATFKASGGDGHYAFSPTGALPAGLSLSAAGVITGTSTAAGTYPFGVKVVDVTTPSLTATQQASLRVTPGAAVVLTVDGPPTGTAGTAFAVTVTAKDRYGNTATAFSGKAQLACSDGQVLAQPAVMLTNGVGTAPVTLQPTTGVRIKATAGGLTGTSGAITVNPKPTDWFAANMPDAGLQAVARSDVARDGALTYADALDVLNSVVAAKTAVTADQFKSLQALASPAGAAAAKTPGYVQDLLSKVVNGDAANAHYQGAALGNLQAGSPAALVQNLVNKWFKGFDHPKIDTSYLWGSATYSLAGGTLFSPTGPSYKDVAQGEEGDCWMLAPLGVTAGKAPTLVSAMFTDDGAATENTAQVHVWTVRFFKNGVASYVTVDNYLPTVNGVFAYADLGQSAAAASNVLWVALAEKAYAQLCESGWNQRPAVNAYASLNGGWGASAFAVITGGQQHPASDYASSAAFVSAINAGRLLSVASGAGNKSLGIVGGHEYGVLGYNSTAQTFTLLNPWGWNNTSGYAGILNLTWAQLQANFSLDGDVSVSAVTPADLVASPAGVPAAGPAGRGAAAPNAAAVTDIGAGFVPVTASPVSPVSADDTGGESGASPAGVPDDGSPWHWTPAADLAAYWAAQPLGGL